jgi:uncharacterized coiled-coil DUF342 family protein
MESISLLEIFVALLAISGTIVGSTIWFLKWQSAKIQTDNEKIIVELKNNNLISFNSLKDDLRDFRSHFDTRISDVYTSVDSKNREMKEFISKELDYIRGHVDSIENKLAKTSEHSHEIEKEILRLQTTIGKDYITREDLKDYLRSRHESNS